MEQFHGSLVNDEEKEQASEVTAVKPDFNFEAKFILTMLDITNTCDARQQSNESLKVCYPCYFSKHQLTFHLKTFTVNIKIPVVCV